MPLYELMEKLFILFSMERIEHQDAYLCAFYDAVTEYQQKHSSELTAFLTYWDEKLHERDHSFGRNRRNPHPVHP